MCGILDINILLGYVVTRCPLLNELSLSISVLSQNHIDMLTAHADVIRVLRVLKIIYLKDELTPTFIRTIEQLSSLRELTLVMRLNDENLIVIR